MYKRQVQYCPRLGLHLSLPDGDFRRGFRHRPGANYQHPDFISPFDTPEKPVSPYKMPDGGKSVRSHSFRRRPFSGHGGLLRRGHDPVSYTHLPLTVVTEQGLENIHSEPTSKNYSLSQRNLFINWDKSHFNLFIITHKIWKNSKFMGKQPKINIFSMNMKSGLSKM